MEYQHHALFVAVVLKTWFNWCVIIKYALNAIKKVKGVLFVNDKNLEPGRGKRLLKIGNELYCLSLGFPLLKC
jgi:hypothetical protein